MNSDEHNQQELEHQEYEGITNERNKKHSSKNTSGDGRDFIYTEKRQEG